MVSEDIKEAAGILKKGGLVAFPTETVYGLGCNAYSDEAVARIFSVKGRPQFNPLIVHVAFPEDAEKLVFFSDISKVLVEHFWPGPLTIVLPRKDNNISYLVSAGLDTVAVRMPSHPIAHALLSEAGIPIAAPSANISGTLSPTSAKDVEETLGSKISMVLDGGFSAVGVESTVLDLRFSPPVLLRAGGVTVEDIEEVLGEKILQQGIYNNEELPRSPGQLLSHYAPGLPVRINVIDPDPNEAFLGFGDLSKGSVLNLSPSGDLQEAAANLFRFLRFLDKPEKYSGISVAPIPSIGLGLAINDRLKRASYPRI